MLRQALFDLMSGFVDMHVDRDIQLFRERADLP